MKITKVIAALVFGLFLTFGTVADVSAQDDTMMKTTQTTTMKSKPRHRRMTRRHHKMMMKHHRMMRRHHRKMKKSM